MLKNYEIRIQLLGVAEEHVIQLEQLLNVVSELIETAGGLVLWTASDLDIVEEEVEHEIDVALAEKTR